MGAGEDLPVMLPTDVEFTGKGGSPLTTSKTFADVKCPVCGRPARRQMMDTFLDSSWYCDPKNDKAPFDPKKAAYWMNVDQYIWPYLRDFSRWRFTIWGLSKMKNLSATCLLREWSTKTERKSANPWEM